MSDKKEFPQKGEVVVGTVTKVNPYSVFIKLEEYDNLEGMVHISEVARKWVRDIRQFVKVGQKVVALVMRVDKDKGHITLSLKRVNYRTAEEKLREFKREKRAIRLLGMAANEAGEKFENTKDIREKLKKEYGSLYAALESIAKDDSEIETLKKLGIKKKLIDAIVSIAKKSFEKKEIKIVADVELKTYSPDGVKIIKKLLSNAEKEGITVKYIAAPEYKFSISSKDPKSAEKKLVSVVENIIDKIEKSNGEGKYTLE